LAPEDPFYYVFQVQTSVQWPNNGSYCNWEYTGDLTLQQLYNSTFNIGVEAGCICAGQIENQ